jgi:ribonuclease R
MSSLPSKDDLLAWIKDNPTSAGKRDIARAFGLRGYERTQLKFLLREMEDEGLLEKRRKKVRPAGSLPPVGMIEVIGPDSDGDLFAKPINWEGEGEPPRILVTPKKSDPAFGRGDRVLAKLQAIKGEDAAYRARPIKKISAGDRRLLGIYRTAPEGGRVVPVDKRNDREWVIPAGENDGAAEGDLVEAEAFGGRIHGLQKGRIVAHHGDPGAPKQVSLIAMVQHQISYAFTDDVLAEADRAEPIEDVGVREDLRDLPLLTIDPADARDHDDAVCAMPDDDAANEGGHIVWVAIADVAHYVRTGTALDRDARNRGNSSYFPDRVSPMLPDRLSGDLCSLHEGVDRPCLAVRMVFDAEGNKTAHRFTRAMMRSPASLSYEQAQAIDNDGAAPDDPVGQAVTQLFAAYRTAAKARERRQPLDLDLPERKIELNDEGEVVAIRTPERLDAHRLIEEFMVLANVCAAETLEKHESRLLYRVHEEPNPEKLDALRESVETVGLTLAKGQVLKTAHLNTLLRGARETNAADMISMLVLRAQTQAYYAPENFGHFGLNLPRYAHFTSPIRRYADLIVHRALIRALKLGEDGLTGEDIDTLQATAEHISQTERRSMAAERDTSDRYLAAYLADREGGEFDGRIAGVARFGVFIRLDETGADGFVPMSHLSGDYYVHDAERNQLRGERTGHVLGLGMPVSVRLVEATPITGGLMLELLTVEGEELPNAGRGRGKHTGKGKGKGAPRRKLSKARAKAAKQARKSKRKS